LKVNWRMKNKIGLILMHFWKNHPKSLWNPYFILILIINIMLFDYSHHNRWQKVAMGHNRVSNMDLKWQLRRSLKLNASAKDRWCYSLTLMTGEGKS
jgi:hypothetical protein